MGPNSTGALLLGIGLSVLVAVGTAVGWDRATGRWRWPARVGALLLGAVLAVGSAAVAANHQLNLFTAWSQLAGTAPGGGPAQEVSTSTAGSRVIRFEVPGAASGISLPALAYLPPGYGDPAHGTVRYPVIEAVDGFPGSPDTWLISLRAARYLDGEIAAGRMAPTVVVFPYQYTDPAHDGECVDAAGGQRWDTFLSTDVPRATAAGLRVRTDRAGWAIIGTSTGGFCAVNLALRHPDRYAAGASLSGYFSALTDHTTGDLYQGSRTLREANSPLWRIQHLPPPDLPLYLATARDDRAAYQEIQRFAAVVRPPLRVTVTVVPRGGHTGQVWQVLEPAAFDWLSDRLAAPLTDPAAASPQVRPAR